MSNELRALLNSVRDYRMSETERTEQMVSFAYGNLRLEEPRVPRSAVEEAARGLVPGPDTRPTPPPTEPHRPGWAEIAPDSDLDQLSERDFVALCAQEGVLL